MGTISRVLFSYRYPDLDWCIPRFLRQQTWLSSAWSSAKYCSVPSPCGGGSLYRIVSTEDPFLEVLYVVPFYDWPSFTRSTYPGPRSLDYRDRDGNRSEILHPLSTFLVKESSDSFASRYPSWRPPHVRNGRLCSNTTAQLRRIWNYVVVAKLL